MDVAVRVIPCLDVDAGRVVKGVNFLNLRDAGDPDLPVSCVHWRDAEIPMACWICSQPRFSIRPATISDTNAVSVA